MANRTRGRARRRVGVIGAGPGGLCAAIRLRQEGYTDVVVWERANGVGGTWRHNTYPGCACDLPSHLYAYSFEPKADWTRPYASQPEIQAYLEHCVDAYGCRAASPSSMSRPTSWSASGRATAAITTASSCRGRSST